MPIILIIVSYFFVDIFVFWSVGFL